MSRAFHYRPRRGVLLQEAVIALMLVVVMLVGVAQLVVATSGQQRAAQQRAWALRAAGNTMEQLMACPWDEATPERAAKMQIPPALEDWLPEATLNAAIAEDGGDVPAKRCTVRIDWRNAAGQRSDPVQLVAWRYRLAAPAESPAPTEEGQP